MSALPMRYLKSLILKDLKHKMVFLGGPRQVGKTTLSQELLGNYYDGHPGYLNWDLSQHRKIIKDKAWPKTQKLIIFDEIHKSTGWRNLIKGIFDTLKNTHSFLITGSARLNVFRKGGDSLLGRYHYYRLHPFSLPELGIDQENLDLLMKFGGFPEPLLRKDEDELQRWHHQRLSHLVRIDLRDLQNVRELDKIESLAEDLPRRVGSPLSFKSLAEDLEVDFKTAKRWVGMLDDLYYCFLVSPYWAPKIRAVKKEQKLYMWDWSQVEDLGARFENMVACQLLKYCHYLEDTKGHKMELRYLRDTDKREIDFVVIKDKKPLFAVECKVNNGKAASPHLFYFADRTPIPKFYQVHLGKDHQRLRENIDLLPFGDFCKIEGMI